MICPHCHRTIEEQDRYLMSRDPKAPLPSWSYAGMLVLLFVVLVGLISIARLH